MKNKTPNNSLTKSAASVADVLAKTIENVNKAAANGSESFLRAISELQDGGQYTEIVNRFYRTLAFGTGGLRGRSIGEVVTASEKGSSTGPRPDQPCAGTNAMNYFNISRATQGLVADMWQAHKKAKAKGRPSIALAHDTRHFSKEFAELAAKVATDLGCDAYVFAGPRSTPQLSFTVRLMNATAGAVVTASHNPPHDNGFKVYFSDGAQIVEPHASAIIKLVNAVTSDTYTPLPKAKQGKRIVLGAKEDNAYMDRLETLLLDRPMVKAASRLKVVLSPIHGTGGVIIKPMLKRLGFRFAVVAEQDKFDGQFPTVKSPNPENAEALSMAIALAEKEAADVVVATDPDSDRMGVAIRNRDGKMQLLTGNQIGSLIAAYRVEKLKALGVITPENAGRCAIIKTLVTTDLQKAIAAKHGLRCVETLTGFKYIGEKLGQYENAIPAKERANYRTLSEEKTRALRLKHSVYYVAGGEESYGYSAHDFVRDKDANAAVVLFAEVCAFAKSRNITVDQLLDEVYANYGYYLEQNKTLEYRGAAGEETIRKLATGFASEPPKMMDGSKVVGVRDFANNNYKDCEGQVLPNEKMVIFDLADGRRVAVRPSGTEPKIKFYLFTKADVSSPAQLAKVKASAAKGLAGLWTWIQSDVALRLKR